MDAPTDFTAIKSRQQTAWASGDYAVIGTTLQIVGEQLAEACALGAMPTPAAETPSSTLVTRSIAFAPTGTRPARSAPTTTGHSSADVPSSFATYLSSSACGQSMPFSTMAAGRSAWGRR